MRVRFLAAVVAVASLAAWSVGCEDIRWDFGLCEEDPDCEDQVSGTRCVNDRCRCVDPDERVCCPDASIHCWPDDLQCRPRTFCDQPPVVVLAAPGAPCVAAEDCRGPIDPRCGATLCDEAKCRFEIQAGETIPNQYSGDCKLNICNFDGDVDEMADPSDFPAGNLCAYGVCEGTEPVWNPVGDGYPCIGKDGICTQAVCRDCSEVMGYLKCPGVLFCDWDTCVPASCKDGVVNGTETATDCGGPSLPACRRCDVGQGCMSDSDCMSRVCKGGVCLAATHDDDVQNGDESGVDCGYPGGKLHMCKDGEGCSSRFDCMSDVCYWGECLAPTCTDTRLNSTEVKPDCGGDTCPPCPPE